MKDGKLMLQGIAMAIGAVLVVGIIYLIAHQIWVDTHCTMVLGTRVCS